MKDIKIEVVDGVYKTVYEDGYKRDATGVEIYLHKQLEEARQENEEMLSENYWCDRAKLAEKERAILSEIFLNEIVDCEDCLRARLGGYTMCGDCATE